jgi:xylulokinase
MNRYFMGIDIGTTGGRACIFDDEGNLIGSAYQEYPCHYPNDGLVEQYSAELLPALYRTSRDAIAASGLQPQLIEAISLSVQGPVLCLLDEKFELMTPLIGWQDLRGAAYIGEAAQLLQDVGEYYVETGSPLAASNPVGKLLWLKKECPKEWEECRYISTASEYFNKKFGADEFVIDPAMASRAMIMDIKNNCFSEKVLDRLGVDINKYPEIVPSGTVIGHINREIAEKTGLSEGTKLVMGSHDQNASTLGMGMIHKGLAGFTLGTAGLVTAVTDNPTYHEKGMLLVKPNASVGNYTLEGISFASASAYKWYRDTLCNAEVDAGSKLGVDAYDIMNQLARKSKPGANGVTFLNFLQGAAGIIHNYSAKGTFSGLTFSTTKSDLTRAVMEGIVYEVKMMTEAIKNMGIDIDEIRISGGGSRSRTWCQIHADILEMPIVLLQCSELSALGAAMLAGLGSGTFTDIEDAVDKCVHVEKKYLPNTNTEKAYKDAYKRYLDCYDAMSKGMIWN